MKTQYETGVYCWRNRVNNKRYVGSASESLMSRRQTHLRDLRRGVHWNQPLQRSWSKYGAKSFVFQILERCPADNVVEREQLWMDFYEVADRRYGYNLSPTAGSSRGTKMSPEQKDNYKLAAKERAKLPAVRAGIEAFKKRLVTDNPNKMWDPEVRDKVSESLKGRKHPREVVEKRNASNTGRKRTISHKANMSEAALENSDNRRRAAFLLHYGFYSEDMLRMTKTERREFARQQLTKGA